MDLVLIPPGEFLMGATEEEIADVLEKAAFSNLSKKMIDFIKAEGPPHKVKLSLPYRLGVCEVTVGQFRAFVDGIQYETEYEQSGGGQGLVGDKWVHDPKFSWKNPGFDQTEQHPVLNVSWYDADQFCRWLSKKEKKTYRLPTEAEWEFACRGGTFTRTFWPETKSKMYAHLFKDKNRAVPQEVGKLAANAFGLQDICGNVAEWCADWYSPTYYSNSPILNPPGPADGEQHVVRGGSVKGFPKLCCSTARLGGQANELVGFRVLCEEVPVPAKK
jgi:formylglycine-generating enzyme required for sulfatase activity